MNNIELMDAVKKRETPFYIYDTDVLEETVESLYRKLFPGVRLCFAMKANPFLTGIAAGLTDRIEVCSFGESRIVKELGIDRRKVLISGVLKKKEDMEREISDFGGEALYTAESAAQFQLLQQAAARQKKHLSVLLRLTNGSQFGMDAFEIEDVLSRRYTNVEVVGLHYFTGTQKRNADCILKELAAVSGFMDRENASHGHKLRMLEYGPGFRIDYFQPKEDFILPDTDWERLNALLSDICSRYQVTFEMGRALTADCGYYLTRVCDVKQNKDTNYAIVDGGIHQLNYDGQIRGMYMPQVSFLQPSDRDTAKEKRKWTVCGSLCTTNDVLLQQQELPDLSPGDVLVFKQTGAYSIMEGMSLFLSHELPAVYFFSGQEGLRLLRKRQESYSFNMPRTVVQEMENYKAALA